MTEPYKDVLERIASSNPTPSIGPGFDPHGFVPAFTINSRVVADALERRLIEEGLSVKCEKSRLVTQFLVAADQLDRSLEIRDQHLSEQPDIVPRRFSNDYDSLFLISPIVIAVSSATFFLPGFPPYAWLAILVTGASAIIMCERINRQYRVSVGSQWSLRELFLATAIVAANVALWNAIM